MIRTVSMLLFSSLVLVGCATTGQRSASAEDRARCEAILQSQTADTQHSHSAEKGVVAQPGALPPHQMGTTTTHSHAEAKGTLAQTPMNREHTRCREILGR